MNPDPLVTGMGPRIRIRTKMSWILNTASNLYLNIFYICVSVGWSSDGAEPGYSLRVRCLAPPLPARPSQARVAVAFHMGGDMGKRSKTGKSGFFSYFYLIKSVFPNFASVRFLDFLLFSNRL
jgi:hypothetical protein